MRVCLPSRLNGYNGLYLWKRPQNPIITNIITPIVVHAKGSMACMHKFNDSD